MASGSEVKYSKSDGFAQESSINDSIDVPPEARFECPICLAWLRDPVVTSCGHRFCRNCIQSWLERENDACPVDNMKLRKDVDIFPDNFTRREISQQRTKCPNIVRGCLEELSPLDVESHLLTCRYKPPEYYLPDNEKLRCTFVDIGCPAKFEDEPSLQLHLAHDIQTHLMLLSKAYKTFSINNQASSSASAIAEQANFWDPPSKSDQGEMSTSTNDSIQNLLKALYEKIVILEQKNREQDIIIANMSEQISAINSTLALRNCNGCYVWYITDFKSKLSTMHNNNHMMYYSPGFYTLYNGYKLCIRFNLSPRDPTYIAILVHMMKTDHDNTLDWPFSGRITVTIVHPRALYEKIVILEQKNREQDIIIANMSEQISAINSTLALRNCNGCYVWYITDFKSKLSTMHNNNHMMYYSPGFYTLYNGYKLCIRFNLSPRDPTYIAILVHMMKTDHDNTLDWPFSGRITVTIVHPSQSFRNIKETMMTRPELDAFKRPAQDLNPKGFGYTEFALLEELLAQDFIYNNQLIVKVTVQSV